MQSVTFTVSPQADGRKYVTYAFLTDAGETFSETSLQAVDFDANASLVAQGVRWDAMLSISEISANVEIVASANNAAFSFKYSTVNQARAAVRQAFKNESGRRLHVIANWLNVNLTDNQLQTLFGLTAPQTATLRTKLQAASTRLAAFDAEAGQ